MAVKVVHLSDLTGRQGDKNEFGELVVRHPDFRDPVRLEVLPPEIESLLKAAARVVQVDYTAPGARSPQRLFVPLDDFNALAGDQDIETILMEAVAAAAQRGHTAGDGQKTSRAGPTKRAKVNYATLEHAGEPHRGRITETEKELVRSHLDQINQRLAREGKRTIDPNDPTIQERYGLSN